MANRTTSICLDPLPNVGENKNPETEPLKIANVHFFPYVCIEQMTLDDVAYSAVYLLIVANLYKLELDDDKQKKYYCIVFQEDHSLHVITFIHNSNALFKPAMSRYWTVVVMQSTVYKVPGFQLMSILWDF